MELYGCDPNPGNDISHTTRQLSYFQKNQINSLLLRVDMETLKFVRSNMKQHTIQITTTALTNQTVGTVTSWLLGKRIVELNLASSTSNPGDTMTEI